MKEQLISFETAKLAKEKGFHWKTSQIYTTAGLILYLESYNWRGYSLNVDHDIQISNQTIKNPKDQYGFDEHIVISTAPPQSLLQKWLREVHDKYISIIFTRMGEADCSYLVELYCWREWKSYNVKTKDFNTYEEALEIGLQEALKLIKNEK